MGEYCTAYDEVTSPQEDNHASNDKESLGKSLKKSVQRKTERILQNIGKSDKTHDDFIVICSDHFTKQCITAVKFQKELKSYISKVRAMMNSSSSLHEMILGIYDDYWSGRKELANEIQNMNSNWLRHIESLCSETLQQVESYINDFAAIKVKMDRQERKRVYFDFTRRTYEQCRAHKKVDEIKLEKARVNLELAQEDYYRITADLYEDLPNFYDRRLMVYCENWLSLFPASRDHFQKMAEVNDRISIVMKSFKEDVVDGKYGVERMKPSFTIGRRNSSPSYSSGTLTRSHRPHRSSLDSNEGSPDSVGGAGLAIPPVATGIPQSESCPRIDEGSRTYTTLNEFEMEDPTYEIIIGCSNVHPKVATNSECKKPPPKASTDTAPEGNPTSEEDSSDDEEDQKIPVDRDLLVLPTITAVKTAETEVEDPDDHIYSTAIKLMKPMKPKSKKVQAKFDYKKKNDDELSFITGDVMELSSMKDKKLEEDGWLFGKNCTSNKEGLIPSNYVEKIL